MKILFPDLRCSYNLNPDIKCRWRCIIVKKLIIDSPSPYEGFSISATFKLLPYSQLRQLAKKTYVKLIANNPGRYVQPA